ncbi:MAG TPA: NAD(P)-binding protein [Burkholderiaceae bacterium]|nr:NAD(P)-binding protein [Burkholderiaceae bacterium]
MKRVAVIGAGIAGLTAASGLLAGGWSVTLFEKSRGAGGRCATRRSEAGAFDHGAPGFTATTDSFRAQVSRWRDSGWVAIEGDSGEVSGDPAAPSYAFGVPSMNSLARQLAAHLPEGANWRPDTQIAAIEPAPGDAEAADGHGGWRLRLLNGDLEPARFDAVVVAVPAEQAAVLLNLDAALSDAMRQTPSDPCWTVMAAWSAPWPVSEAVYRCADPRGTLSLARRDDDRTGRTEVAGIGCRWVLHATPAWTREHLEAVPADVKAALLAAFGQHCGVHHAVPQFSTAHRWRHARVPSPRHEPFGWNPVLRLGACGDAWHGATDSQSLQDDGIERAWLSGRALAQRMVLEGVPLDRRVPSAVTGEAGEPA